MNSTIQAPDKVLLPVHLARNADRSYDCFSLSLGLQGNAVLILIGFITS